MRMLIAFLVVIISYCTARVRRNARERIHKAYLVTALNVILHVISTDVDRQVIKKFKNVLFVLI